MPVFTLLDKSTGREWHWKQLAGVDSKYKRMMDPDTTNVFRQLLRKHKGATCSKITREFAWTINYAGHGGSRQGAGRKAGGKNKQHIPDHKRRVTIGCRLPQYKVDWIKRQPGTVAETIERGIDTLMLASAHKSHKPPG